jgi:tRNA dimethylallyltransferase
VDTEKRVLVITGPTATGKSALGVECALRLGGEVISADSMQLYRGMDIGTAKLSPAEMRGVPHHLVDVADPAENWSVSRWVDAAAACAADIFSRGRVPILVGGTNLYIDSLLSGRDFAAREDPALRERLNGEYDARGGAAFWEKLRAVDPERAAVLHPADKKRLVRALEVWELTGETISAHDARTRALPPRWPSLRVALSFADRADLYARIGARADAMLRDGLFDEVEALLARGLSPACTSMQAIGYKEAADYFCGRLTGAEAVEAIKRSSRRYAKRQLTWLRRDADVHWILWDGAPDIPAAADTVATLWAEK